ncbi:putative trichoplein, partial [Operophtera brumata]
MEQIVEKEVQKKKEEEETRKTLQERDEALRKEIAIEQEKIRDKEEKAMLEALRLISSEREREHARLVSERDAHIINMGLYKFKLKRRVLSEYELEHSKHGSYKRVLDAALEELKEHRERERQRQRNIEAITLGRDPHSPFRYVTTDLLKDLGLIFRNKSNQSASLLWAKEREARAALMNEVIKSLKRQLEEKIELSRLKQKENVLEREQILDQMDSFHQEVRSRERENK